MSDLLVVASDVALRGAAVRHAAALAARLGASVSGLYMVPGCPREYDFAPASLAGEIIEICRQQRDRAAEAADEFASWAASNQVASGSWHYSEGEAVDAIVAAAMWHDLLVVPRDFSLSWSDAARVLVRVDVPCVVVPETCGDFRLETVAIAWNASPQATRALHAAMPLLEQAQRVQLIDGSGIAPAPEPRTFDPGADLESYLRGRCANVTRVRLDENASRAGEDILALASEASADILIMGAYGRTRFGEWIFGGATRHVLEHAALPVLLRH